jgi:hypothetical protein
VNYTLNQNGDPKTEWRSVNVEDKMGAPKPGVIYFYLGAEDASGGATEVHFQNFKFEYIPYINGSYKKYDGERITDSQPGRYSNPQLLETKISASQKILFKGALLNYDSGADLITLLSDRWFDWSYYHAGAPYDAIYPEIDKRMKWVGLDHYNHYRNTQREFNFSLRGLVADNGQRCDLDHVYRITVDSRHNNFKSFVLTSLKQNLKSGAWSGAMVEIDDSRDKFAEVIAFESEHKYIE